MNTIATLSILAAVAAAAPGAPSAHAPAAQVPRGMGARPRLGNVAYGVQIRSCTQPNKLALTFDDGPSEYTPAILDLLASNGGLKATFFVNGKNGQNGVSYPQHAATLKRMVGEGHQVGSHSWSHANFDLIGAEEQAQEVLQLEDKIGEILGFVPTYFRPPYTACGGGCLGTLGELGYHVTDYDLDTKDFELDYDFAKNTFSGGIAPGVSHIVLAHDIHEGTAYNLAPYMIKLGKQTGYDFVTIGECLGDDPANWYRDPSTGGGFNVKPPTPSPTKTPEPTTSSTSSSSSSTSTTSSSRSKSSSSSSSTSASAPSSTAKTTSSGNNRGSSSTPAPITSDSSSSSSNSAPSPTQSQGAAAGVAVTSRTVLGGVLGAVAGWMLLL